MDVSIIYVNYKTASLVLDSIKSVQKNTKEFEYEFIVVDNGSIQNEALLLQKKYPEVHVIRSEQNRFFGRK